MAEAALGRSVRCFGCRQPFVAGAEPPRDEALPTLRPRLVSQEEAGPASGPLCPTCERRVSWYVARCPHCGEELDTEDRPPPPGPLPWELRRDGEPHRGPAIARLGAACLIGALLTLCMGLGALLSLPAGITAWVMANHDLELMRGGLMDPRGRALTENGRAFAVVGLVLTLGFVALLAATYFAP